MDERFLMSCKLLVQAAVAATAIYSVGCQRQSINADESKKAYRELLTVVRSADRVEFDMEDEAGSRIGPVVILDKDAVESLKSEMERLTDVQANPAPFADVVSGIAARLVFIRSSGFKSARVRLVGTSFVAFPQSEKYSGSLPDWSLWKKLDEFADKHAKSHPEDHLR